MYDNKSRVLNITWGVLAILVGIALFIGLSKNGYRGTIFDGLFGGMSKQESILWHECYHFDGEFFSFISLVAVVKKDPRLLPQEGELTLQNLMSPEFFEAVRDQRSATLTREDVIRIIKRQYPHLISKKDPWGNPLRINIEYRKNPVVYFKDGSIKKFSTIEEMAQEITQEDREEVYLRDAMYYTITFSSYGPNGRNEFGKGDDFIWKMKHQLPLMLF